MQKFKDYPGLSPSTPPGGLRHGGQRYWDILEYTGNTGTSSNTGKYTGKRYFLENIRTKFQYPTDQYLKILEIEYLHF